MYDYDISPYARGLDSSLTTAQEAGIAATLGAMMGVYIIIALVISVLQIIAMWKIYTKAGEKGWKSIIPIYNLVILYKICGLSPWLLLVYFASIIPIIGPIAILVLTIYMLYCLAKSFGKSGGFTVGLLFLSTIFYMILGFGSAQYVGPYAKTKKEIA